MKFSLISPITEVWSRWEGQGYPQTTKTGVTVYYTAGYLQDLSDPAVQANLGATLVLDGTFPDTETAQTAIDQSYVFSGFVYVDEKNGKKSLRYQEPYQAQPDQEAHAVTWVEVHLAD